MSAPCSRTLGCAQVTYDGYCRWGEALDEDVVSIRRADVCRANVTAAGVGLALPAESTVYTKHDAVERALALGQSYIYEIPYALHGSGFCEPRRCEPQKGWKTEGTAYYSGSDSRLVCEAACREDPECVAFGHDGTCYRYKVEPTLSWDAAWTSGTCAYQADRGPATVEKGQ